MHSNYKVFAPENDKFWNIWQKYISFQFFYSDYFAFFLHTEIHVTLLSQNDNWWKVSESKISMDTRKGLEKHQAIGIWPENYMPDQKKASPSLSHTDTTMLVFGPSVVRSSEFSKAGRNIDFCRCELIQSFKMTAWIIYRCH